MVVEMRFVACSVSLFEETQGDGLLLGSISPLILKPAEEMIAPEK